MSDHAAKLLAEAISSSLGWLALAIFLGLTYIAWHKE